MALINGALARLPRNQHPRPTVLRYGLFTVAPPATIFPEPGGDQNVVDHAFGNGMYYDPYGCGAAHPYEIVCDTPAEKDFDDNSPEREVLPFVVYASLLCGAPAGYPVQYLTDKTGDRLFSSAQHAVEAAFWTGTAGQAPSIDEGATAVDVSGAGLTYPNIVAAVAALEAFAYGGDANNPPYGYHAVLHANTAVAAYAQADHLVHCASEKFYVWGTTPTDPALRTAIGTKWVFGGGYPGTGADGAAPGAGETYIWITGNVALWRTAAWGPPSVFEVMDREGNQFKILAEQPYLATYDCFNAYALVDIPEAPA